jgi:uncharacterized membrane protein AbrB (regulator of aidB expression)
MVEYYQNAFLTISVLIVAESSIYLKMAKKSRNINNMTLFFSCVGELLPSNFEATP